MLRAVREKGSYESIFRTYQQGSFQFASRNFYPEFLAAVPRDWADGAPLRYRLNPDGTFTLYSVWGDGVDQGGDPGHVGDEPATWMSGRDLIWRQPASPAAIEAARDTRTKRPR